MSTELTPAWQASASGAEETPSQRDSRGRPRIPAGPSLRPSATTARPSGPASMTTTIQPATGRRSLMRWHDSCGRRGPRHSGDRSRRCIGSRPRRGRSRAAVLDGCSPPRARCSAHHPRLERGGGRDRPTRADDGRAAPCGSDHAGCCGVRRVMCATVDPPRPDILSGARSQSVTRTEPTTVQQRRRRGPSGKRSAAKRGPAVTCAGRCVRVEPLVAVAPEVQPAAVAAKRSR